MHLSTTKKSGTMKKIGLIGGTSWHSTEVYYRLINEITSGHIGREENPELLLYSINIAIMREQDADKISKKYLEVAQTLQKAGAQAIVICANTPHMVFDHVQPKIDIPILHIADAIGKEARRLNLTRLGLLGNKPTMTGGFIRDYLERHYDLEVLIPETHCHSQAHHYVSNELTQGRFTDEARRFFNNQIGMLRQRGAEGIILGCTELPILLPTSEEGIILLPTTQLHAKMAVDFILG